mmetsp:Transcript_6392/g.14747  ORF Transcript_6392/g.14747 Transcript_6392/m.14747 type:complete len:234 (-) Transcript_6392:540-1241(-)
MSARKLLIGDDGAVCKLEYFDIEGVAEQVRIAFSVADVPFEDVRVAWSDWGSKKPTTKYGQLPQLILPDGTIVTQSEAMLRLAGAADKQGKLYPDDAKSRLEIDQLLGLVGDFARAWRPCLYIGMRPQAFGHPEKKDWADADKTIEKLRTEFIKNELPRYLEYFAEKHGKDKFLTGDDLTIADIAVYMQIRYFTRGIADYAPKDCVDKYPDSIAYLKRVEEHPKVAEYKKNKA